MPHLQVAYATGGAYILVPRYQAACMPRVAYAGTQVAYATVKWVLRY